MTLCLRDWLVTGSLEKQLLLEAGGKEETAIISSQCTLLRSKMIWESSWPTLAEAQATEGKRNLEPTIDLSILAAAVLFGFVELAAALVRHEKKKQTKVNLWELPCAAITLFHASSGLWILKPNLLELTLAHGSPTVEIIPSCVWPSWLVPNRTISTPSRLAMIHALLLRKFHFFTHWDANIGLKLALSHHDDDPILARSLTQIILDRFFCDCEKLPLIGENDVRALGYIVFFLFFFFSLPCSSVLDLFINSWLTESRFDMVVERLYERSDSGDTVLMRAAGTSLCNLFGFLIAIGVGHHQLDIPDFYGASSRYLCGLAGSETMALALDGGTPIFHHYRTLYQTELGLIVPHLPTDLFVLVLDYLPMLPLPWPASVESMWQSLLRSLRK